MFASPGCDQAGSILHQGIGGLGFPKVDIEGSNQEGLTRRKIEGRLARFEMRSPIGKADSAR